MVRRPMFVGTSTSTRTLTLATTGQATERDKKPVSSSSLNPRPACTSRMSCRSPRTPCPPRKGMHCISRESEAVGEGARKQHGCGGPRLEGSHGRLPISRCRLSKPSDSCRLPGYGMGTASLFYPTAMRENEMPEGNTWPDVESWIDWLHIHQTRPNVPVVSAWVPGRVVNICSRLQKSLVAMLLSFSLLLFPRP